jgi:hypothetical protein
VPNVIALASIDFPRIAYLAKGYQQFIAFGVDPVAQLKIVAPSPMILQACVKGLLFRFSDIHAIATKPKTVNARAFWYMLTERTKSERNSLTLRGAGVTNLR